MVDRMARLARVVAPWHPHHVTQRGNRRQQTFFVEADYEAYLTLMAEHCGAAGVEIWAYCLMPNHVHLVAVPPSREAFVGAIGEAHRRYTRRVNFREGWRGHLWQGRFASSVMDESHLLAAVRYVELNPVRARLVQSPAEWRWSSARAHLEGRDDDLVTVRPMADRVDDWQAYLDTGLSDEEAERIRYGERTGRPLGAKTFVERLEKELGRRLRPRKRGPKPKSTRS
jgi:putative transposase